LVQAFNSSKDSTFDFFLPSQTPVILYFKNIGTLPSPIPLQMLFKNNGIHYRENLIVEKGF
jgi:hypothetical protein